MQATWCGWLDLWQSRDNRIEEKRGLDNFEY